MLATNIAAGLEVREDVIRRHVAEQMPFMATERWLMLGVAAGGDRQELHEVIRRHSLAVAEAVSRGEPNDLLERLAGDPAFARRSGCRAAGRAEPSTYTGRAERAGRRIPRPSTCTLCSRGRARSRPKPRRRRCGYDARWPRAGCRFPLLRRGKVREVYEVDADHLLLVASDRVSAFDVVMREPIPRKGAVLTQMSAFWFERLAEVFPSHFVTARTEEILARLPALRPHAAEMAGRAMLVRRTAPVAFECVVRGYLSGSAWAEYRERGTLAGEPLPAGLLESGRLEPPIFSPATKAESGPRPQRHLRRRGRRRWARSWPAGCGTRASRCIAPAATTRPPGASSSRTPSSSSAPMPAAPSG